MNDNQIITLRDILRDKGLSDRRIDDVFLLLRYKPERVQLVFYYAAQGWSQRDIALTVGVSQPVVNHYLNNGMLEIREYLKENTSL